MDERQIEAAEAMVANERDGSLARIRAELATPGAAECIDCGNEIEERRRAALPSAVRCVGCQERRETAVRRAA